MVSDEILNIREAADYLKVPVSTLYKLAHNGEIPGAKVGKHWRFRKMELDHLFEQRVGPGPKTD